MAGSMETKKLDRNGKSFLPGRRSYTPQTRGQSGIRPPVLQELAPQPVEDASKSPKFVIGDRVCISGVKPGRLLYYGKFPLGKGLWCGIELDEPVGKHDGMFEEVRYFTAKPGHGIFAPVDKVALHVAREDTAITKPVVQQQGQQPAAAFRSKLQRRVLHYPKTASQLTKDPEKGSAESLSSQSETGSEASQKISNSNTSAASVASGTQIKKPKLSLLRKPSGIPKIGRQISPVESESIPVPSEGPDKSCRLRQPKISSGTGINLPADYKTQDFAGILPQTAVRSNVLKSTQVLKPSDLESVGYSEANNAVNTTQSLETEGRDVLNRTQVIHASTESSGQIRVHQKRSQSDDHKFSEQDSKRPRYSQLPLSRMLESSSLQPESEATIHVPLNATFTRTPAQKKVPAGSPCTKANETFSLQDKGDTEDVGAFSPEVHRQLVAGGRQYLNLTFDAEYPESAGADVFDNVTHIKSPSYSANSDELAEDEFSELDSSLEFLQGDRLIGEYTRLGILRPEELDNTELIPTSLLEAGPDLLGNYYVGRKAELRDPNLPFDPESESESDIFRRYLSTRRAGVHPNLKVKLYSARASNNDSTGPPGSAVLREVEDTFFLANPLIQKLKLKNSVDFRSSDEDFVHGEKILADVRHKERIVSIDSNENFSLSEAAVTSTPLVPFPGRQKMDGMDIEEDEVQTEHHIPSTPELQIQQLSISAASAELHVEDVRRNLDLTNNAYQENIDPPKSEAANANPKELGSTIAQSEAQPVIEEFLAKTEPSGPVGSVTSVDAEVVQLPTENPMQTSLVMSDLLVKSESKPMTDSGIDNVMTASQEMVSSQTSEDKRILPSTGLTSTGDKLEQILDEQSQLAADLFAGHTKTDRPLSLISSISSVDTGYVPDIGSERGTLTTNSPTEWPEIHGAQQGDEKQKNLTEIYTETFQIYQEGMMKGVTGCMEKDSDICSDKGTMLATTDREESDLEGTRMEVVDKAGNETVTGEELSDTESSNNVTEKIMTGVEDYDQQDTVFESSSDKNSREGSLEPGEQTMDTATYVESNMTDKSTCRMEMDGSKGDSSAANRKESEILSKSSEDEKVEKDSKSNAKGKKLQQNLNKNHPKNPNVKVGSKLAEYLKASQPTKPNEGGENVTKAKKNLANSSKDASKLKSSLNKSDEQGEDAEVKSKRERVKREKEPPKIIKRTTPKSKWGDIMSQIESHKESLPKPKEKVVKSHLESIFSQAPAPKHEVKKVESKLAKKRVYSSPKPDYSQVKSRLSNGSPSVKSINAAARVRTGSMSSTGVVLHLDPSSSVNDNINNTAPSSARSSRSDISGLGYPDSKHKARPVNVKTSSLMKFERPQSASSTHSDDVSMTSSKAMNEKNIHKSPQRKSEIKSRIPPTAPRRSSPAKSSPARSSPAKSSVKPLETPTSKQPTKSAPVSKRPTSSSHQNRNKNIKSKTANNQKSLEAEQDNSAKAAEEINRLEALCEAQTKEITYLKRQRKNEVRAFDAMTTLVNYLTQELDAFSCPVKKRKIDTLQKELSDTRIRLSNLDEYKTNLEEEIVSQNKQHDTSLAAVSSEHANELIEAQNALKKEHQMKLERVLEKHSQEIDNLRNYHERHIKEIELDNDEKTHQLKMANMEEIQSLRSKHDDQMEELHRQHKDKLEDITLRFEGMKVSLLEKVDTLHRDCEELRCRARISEEASLRDRDVSVQMAVAPYLNLPKEIDSLKLVLNMKIDEGHELRRQKLEAEMQLEELPIVREKCISLKRQVENLEAIVTMKTDHEKQLSDKCQMLMKKYEQKNRQSQRLSMNMEELMWKVNESESEHGSTESVAVKKQAIHCPTLSSASERKTSVMHRNVKTSSEKKLKHRSGTFVLEKDNQSTAANLNSRHSPPSNESTSEAVLSACKSSIPEIDPLDGPHGLPPPLEPPEWQTEEDVNTEDIDVHVEGEESSASTTDTTSSESGVQESVV